MNRRLLATLAASVFWFALGLQLVLMYRNNPEWAVSRTLTQFFSYFTILTNFLCAVYFTGQAFGARWSFRPGLLTALTGYILVVGISYQLLLRHVWSPQGWDRVADELLHSLDPLIPLIWWIAYERKREVHYRQILRWLLFPLVYLIYTLIRGPIAGWYPYYFVDVDKIGMRQTLINSGALVLVFLLILVVLIAAGRKLGRAVTN